MLANFQLDYISRDHFSAGATRFSAFCLLALLTCAINPLNAQQTEDLVLIAMDGATFDSFGNSVAVDGNIAIVGAPYDSDNGLSSGSAYLFDVSSGQQIAKLLPNDGATLDLFGISVAIDGNIAIVGAHGDDDNGDNSGSAYLFDVSSGQQIAKLLPNDGAASDQFGRSVAINGNIAIVGARQDDDNGLTSGSAYLFDVATAQQISKLLPDDGATGDEFGNSVAIDGNTAIVGAWLDDDNGIESGSAYLFDLNTGQQSAKLIPDDGAPQDVFGRSVDVDGNIAVVGATGDDDNGDSSGSAYLFDVTTGQQAGKLVPNDSDENDNFGYSVAISGGAVIVGSLAFEAQFACLFDVTTGQQFTNLTASDGDANDTFGRAVAINGVDIVVGAETSDCDGVPDAGSAYLYSVTPEFRHDQTGTFAWDDPANWILSILPDSRHDISISTDSSMTLLGPGAEDVLLNSFAFGDGSGIVTLDLLNGKSLTSNSAIEIGTNGILTGDGGLIVENFDVLWNYGAIEADNVKTSGFVENLGLVTGDGQLYSDITTSFLTNYGQGQIRSVSEQHLDLGYDLLLNLGLVDVVEATLELDGQFSNINGSSIGLIYARDASLRFNGSLVNFGAMAVSVGATDVYGNVINEVGGIISITGGGTATFIDDVVQNGELQVANNGSAVFFGSLSGSGNISGGGDVYALGDLRPGNSPASVTVDANLSMGFGTHTEIEIEGINTGEFDQLVISGDVYIDGSLDVSLSENFELMPGDEFVILDVAGSLQGQFDNLDEGSSLGTAAVIDFQELEMAGTGSSNWGTIYNADGYTLTSPGAGIFRTWHIDDPQYAGSTAMRNSNSNGQIVLTSGNGQPFDLISMSIANLLSNGPATVNFTGNLTGGGMVAASYTTMSMANILEPFTFPETFRNLDSVQWVQEAPFHQFDDIRISQGVNLLISYMGGDGNDVVLTTDTPTVLLGDVNLDGVVNLLDVEPFISLLSSGVFQAEADTNEDGVVNLLDVDPFIVILSGP